jgi:AMP-activated protein kinase-like protein
MKVVDTDEIRRRAGQGRHAVPARSATEATDAGLRSQPPADSWAELTIESLDGVIQKIFGVGLTLSACINLVGSTGTERLAVAIDELDAVIAGLRRTVFDCVRVVARTGGVEVASMVPDRPEEIEPAATLAGLIATLKTSAPSDDADPLELLDATHCLYRALVTLTAEPVPVTRPHWRVRPSGGPPKSSPPSGGSSNHANSPSPRSSNGANMSARRTAKPKTVPVTFTLPADVCADEVALCGEFNNWSPDHTRLTRADHGDWRATLSLEAGRTYRYRYLLDGQRWENAWDAADYVPNPYGEDDSVVVAPA